MAHLQDRCDSLEFATYLNVCDGGLKPNLRILTMRETQAGPTRFLRVGRGEDRPGRTPAFGAVGLLTGGR